MRREETKRSLPGNLPCLLGQPAQSINTNCPTFSVFAGEAAAEKLLIGKLRICVSLRAGVTAQYNFSPTVVRAYQHPRLEPLVENADS